MNTSRPESILKPVFDTLSLLQNHLGVTIQAIHLSGSAADGGLKPFSDIDPDAALAKLP